MPSYRLLENYIFTRSSVKIIAYLQFLFIWKHHLTTDMQKKVCFLTDTGAMYELICVCCWPSGRTFSLHVSM